jgi:hypothetical protein
MIENYRSGMLWELRRDCAPIRLGLERAGFSGGWLKAASTPAASANFKREDTA